MKKCRVFLDRETSYIGLTKMENQGDDERNAASETIGLIQYMPYEVNLNCLTPIAIYQEEMQRKAASSTCPTNTQAIRISCNSISQLISNASSLPGIDGP